jgi:hypothetical protein
MGKDIAAEWNVDGMAAYSHALYIDESGNGASRNDILRLWITAGIAIPFDQKLRLDTGVQSILGNHFRHRHKELKGASMPNGLRHGSSITDVSRELAILIKQVGAHCWVVGTQAGAVAPANFPIQDAKPKDITRQFLFERVNGFLNIGYDLKDDWLIIWDLSDAQELNSFSHNVATFQNAFNQAPLNPRLAPAVLGGLSHDWSGLQIADMIAHLAMHNLGVELGLSGSNRQKAKDFRDFLYPLLQKAAGGNVVGWKWY